MRCIEIARKRVVKQFNRRININMRCIEMIKGKLGINAVLD